MHATGWRDLIPPSRRSFLGRLAIFSGLARFDPSAFGAAGIDRGIEVPSSIIEYPDAATDLPVVRLTDPTVTSVLPPFNASSLSRRGDFLIYASDLSGRMQVYRADFSKPVDKKAGPKLELRQWTDANLLNPSGFCLMPGDRGFLYVDRRVLFMAGFSTAKPAALYQFPEGFDIGRGMAVSSDGLYATVVEKKPGQNRLRLIHLRAGTTGVLSDAEEEIAEPAIRPKRASVLYRRGAGLFLANFDGQQNYRLKLADGDVRSATWSPDGRSVLYLNVPPDPAKLVNLREFTPDTNQDRLIAETSQFAGFGRNTDASVFAGASSSKASPYVLLLVRAVKRELTLCEHRASDPAMVAPMFSPNSQQVFFTSDLHGKPAIYRMDVAKLVAETKLLAETKDQTVPGERSK